MKFLLWISIFGALLSYNAGLGRPVTKEEAVIPDLPPVSEEETTEPDELPETEALSAAAQAEQLKLELDSPEGSEKSEEADRVDEPLADYTEPIDSEETDVIFENGAEPRIMESQERESAESAELALIPR